MKFVKAFLQRIASRSEPTGPKGGLPADARRAPVPPQPEQGASVDVFLAWLDRHRAVTADHANYLARHIQEKYFEPAGVTAKAEFHRATSVDDHFAFWFWTALAPLAEPPPDWLPRLCADICEFARINGEPAYAAFFLADFRVSENARVKEWFTQEARDLAREILSERAEADRRRADESGY